MAQAAEEVDALKEKHKAIAEQLDVDPKITEESWKSYETISQKFTLDGEPLHWIACSLYVSCHKQSSLLVTRIGSEPGNNLILSQLFDLCNISLIQFFKTIEKWIDMATLPEDFKNRVKNLKRNFAVSTELFRKFKPIFADLFIKMENGDTINAVAGGSKKPKLQVCSMSGVFELCWCLFVCVKGEFQAQSGDLVVMYHVLLSCVDYVFANAFMAQRRDLINHTFEGLPPNWSSPDFEMPAEAPCIIALLCQKHNGLQIQAKSMKQTLRKVYKKFFTDLKLKGDNKTLTGLLDLTTFESNLKAFNKFYETNVLPVVEFDERIFISEKGTGANVEGEELTKALATCSSESRSLMPDTPLTGRGHLKRKSELLTPVTTATQSVAKLHNYLSGCHNAPEPSLINLLRDCKENLLDSVVSHSKNLGAQFLLAYSPLSSETTAANTLNLAEALYFRLLEQIIRDEQRKKPHVDLQSLVSQEVFLQALLACCLEIVMYAYSVHNTRFPWILECLRLDAFYFYKIIELVVLVIKEKLSRDLVKHLNAIEEQVLESLAWSSSSPIWERIRSLEGSIPQWCEVSISPAAAAAAAAAAVRSLQAAPGPSSHSSPVSSATERFLSPALEPTRKQLFNDSNIRPGQSLLNQNAANIQGNTVSPSNGKQTGKDAQQQLKKKKAGSLSLFFRKFYSLASVRMHELCTKLKLEDVELKRKIWTCLEYSIRQQTSLMQDRHLDQMLMCAVYVVCKVSHTPENGVDRTFTEIMKCYRLQPQAAGHVYRNVLLAQPATTPAEGNEGAGARVKAERGDLIKFYNEVYVRCMQTFILRFTRPEACPLSPLPPARSSAHSAGAGGLARRVSEQHQLYVRPLQDSPSTQATTHTTMTYCFSRSPAKDLHNINAMMSREALGFLKRPSTDPLSVEAGSKKAPASPSIYSGKVQEIYIIEAPTVTNSPVT